jgi:phosphoglycerate dehydrogenase-like enzyme
MTPSTSLSLATEIAIILRAQIPQYPPGNRNAEAFDEASKIVVREEKVTASLREMVRIVEAMRMTTGLGKNQIERLERAKALLANTQISNAPSSAEQKH